MLLKILDHFMHPLRITEQINLSPLFTSRRLCMNLVTAHVDDLNKSDYILVHYLGHTNCLLGTEQKNKLFIQS